MTPTRIDQAIAMGVENRPEPYALRGRSSWIEFNTPFLRVCERAASATVADRSIATAELLAPELRVTAGPEPLGENVPSVKKLLIVKPDGASITPVSHESYVDYAQTARRKKIALKGMRAVFPITALQPGSSFRLVMSDGSDTLTFLDPKTFAATKTLRIMEAGRPVGNLNELEWIEGEIWANVWMTDRIARISPNTGEVNAWIDLSSLYPASQRVPPADVMNGIAYDKATRRIYITGKKWPRLYQIVVS